MRQDTTDTRRRLILAGEEQMAAGQRKKHEEEKNTGIKGENKKSRKQGKKARKSYWRRPYASRLMLNKVTLSAIFFLLSSTAVSSVTTPAQWTNQRKPNKTNRTPGLYYSAVATQGPLIVNSRVWTKNENMMKEPILPWDWWDWWVPGISNRSMSQAQVSLFTTNMQKHVYEYS